MNYLAHIFLSGDDVHVQIGNFIGDFVKGNQPDKFPKRIRKGLLLHRKIDHFTDSHVVVKETIALLRPVFGRYSGIIADMYFDYFLAVSFSTYSPDQSLTRLARRFYFFAILNYRRLPHKVQRFIFHFAGSNRLVRYATIDGLHASLQIMSRYKTSAIDPEVTIQFLIENREVLEKKFHLFFPDLVEYVDGIRNSEGFVFS